MTYSRSVVRWTTYLPTRASVECGIFWIRRHKSLHKGTTCNRREMMIYHFCEPKKARKLTVWLLKTIRLNSHYGNTGYGVSLFEIQNPIDFCLNSEVYQRIFLYTWNGILKWNNGEPTKFGPIFTKLTFLSWVQFFRSHLIIFSPDIYIVTLVDTHMYLQPCTFYDSQGTEALPSFWTFQRGIHSRTLACLNGDGKW